MVLSKNEIKGLMKLIGLTQDEEINCEQCLSSVAEFAERKLEGKSVPEALKSIEHHLAICTECREEYELLQIAMKKMHK